jgi:hypothetical protein
MSKKGVLRISSDIGFDVELAGAAVGIHVSDLAIDRTLEPCSVMHAPYAPGNAHISIWITSIKSVSVIQVNTDGECLIG